MLLKTEIKEFLMSQDNEMHAKIPSVTGIALILGSIIAITGFM